MVSRRKNANKNDTTLDVDELDEESGDEVPEVENLTLGPVENSDEVPLFANKFQDARRAIHVLKIVKLDQPGAGYKGEIPKNSTLETISQMFGDGLYNIEAINSNYKVLRVMQNVRISLNSGVAGSGASKQQLLPYMPTGNSKEELDRIERLAGANAQQAVEQARQFTELVTTTVTSAAERERSFMQGVQENSQVFFTNLMTMQTQGFQQVLALMQAGHNQTMEAMRAANKANDPNDLIKLLISGIQMGRDMDEPEEQPFWQQILQGGVGLLSNVKASDAGKMVQLPPPMEPPKLDAGNGKKKSQKTSKEARDMLRLYKALRTRGIDIESVLVQLEAGTSNANKAESERVAPEAPDESDVEDDDSEDSEDAEQNGEPEELEGAGELDSPADTN